MRYLLVLLVLLVLAGVAYAAPPNLLFELNGNNVVTGWGGAQRTAVPGNTIVSVPAANRTTLTTDGSGLTNTIYRYVAPNIVLRLPADLAAERVVKSRQDAFQNLITVRAQIRAIRDLITSIPANDPGVAGLQLRLSQAATQCTSYASQAGISATTSTTK